MTILTPKVRGHEEPDVHDEVAKRVASWWWGGGDEDIASHLSAARIIARDPIHEAIYLARVADDTSKYRQLKDWAYGVAVEYAGAKGSAQRRRSLVESYRTDWGHQAARDGLARALWPSEVEYMPGVNKQAARFGVGNQAYQRVRDEVQSRALDGFVEYMFDLGCLAQGRWTQHMILRWEAATGADFRHALI
ncbi:hypothetical protein [Luteimonas saliphila]|uniref:hypothetical protein n=1 Tax=Luteimonas saliphila TaxID=2804919 RepID=UPI00192D1F04|nr:hypothetical protein [Luteimonas saliphila]